MTGDFLFMLHDTHGFPLSMSFSECRERGIKIDWIGLIEAARRRGWWDFKIIEEIQAAMTDSGIESKDHILNAVKFYFLKNPHPMMVF